jgi:hypothetical protein
MADETWFDRKKDGEKKPLKKGTSGKCISLS